ncbi:hypothetical protein JYU34_000422 [Plutella xylostella]|uniref:Uncharacterized protein n=1 Tax=Plutella xylostella TaxID=51655 RepID=A0ABQ7R7N8_PLUXY|nr:hypothetical protein JYU34_000422 [Plutella xylostella]
MIYAAARLRRWATPLWPWTNEEPRRPTEAGGSGTAFFCPGPVVIEPAPWILVYDSSDSAVCSQAVVRGEVECCEIGCGEPMLSRGAPWGTRSTKCWV